MFRGSEKELNHRRQERQKIPKIKGKQRCLRLQSGACGSGRGLAALVGGISECLWIGVWYVQNSLVFFILVVLFKREVAEA